MTRSCSSTLRTCFDPTGFETIGYSTFALGLVPASGEPLLLVREMEQVGARRSSWLATDPAIYHDDEEPSEAAVALLRAQGLAGARIGPHALALLAGGCLSPHAGRPGDGELR